MSDSYPVMKAAVIVGHEEDAPGACSDYLGECEYSFNSRLAEYMKERAPEMTGVPYQYPEGIELDIIYRDGIGIGGAAQKADDSGADAALSLHFNSAASPQATGSEVLYWHTSKGGQSLAETTLNEIKMALSLPMRGLLPIDPVDDDGQWDDRGQILSMTSMPHILVEPFFGSNDNDARVAERNFEALGDAYLFALKSFAHHHNN